MSEIPSAEPSEPAETPSLTAIPNVETHKSPPHRLTSRMWLRRFRWWLWIYAWVALGLMVLSLLIVGGSSYAYLSDGSRLISSYALQDFLLCRSFEWFLGMWVFIVGCCIASFLNVVAYRLPLGLSVNGHSFCPHCKVAIEKRDNLPILGWLHLQGRCRACKIRISPRYPVFEAIGGLLLLSIFLSTILSHGRNLPSVHQQGMPYGLPVNLRLLEPIVFEFAALHAWLLLILYTAALTKMSGGLLPIWVWIMSATVVLVAITVCPELVVLPIERPNPQDIRPHSHMNEVAMDGLPIDEVAIDGQPMDGLPMDEAPIDESGHYLISRSIAAMTTGLGTLFALVLGTITYPRGLSKTTNYQSPQTEQKALAKGPSPAREFFMWLGPCVLIGSALGIEGLLGVLLFSALGRLLLRKSIAVKLKNGTLRAATLRFLGRGPVCTLWLFAAVWLCSWSYFHTLFFNISESGTVIWTDSRNIAVLSLTFILLVLNAFWEFSSDAILSSGDAGPSLSQNSD